MQQRDYIEKQIEAMGRFLAGLFSKVGGSGPAPDAAVEEAARVFEQEMGFSLDEVMEMPEVELVQRLLATGNFDAANLEKLADVLAAFAERQNNKGLYSRALYLYQYLDKENMEFSFARNAKINRIKALIL